MSRLDHDANVRPWVQAAARAGAVVRWAEIDLPTGELPAGQYARCCRDRTRLVAVTAASNVLGTRPDVRRDHRPGPRRRARSATSTACTPPRTARPTWPRWAPTSTPPAPTSGRAARRGRHRRPGTAGLAAPGQAGALAGRVPDRFEQGTPPFADLAGVDRGRGPPGRRWSDAAAGTRRERLLAAMAAVAEHEKRLFRVLLGGLAAMPRVTLYGKARRRTATAYFTVAGRDPGRGGRAPGRAQGQRVERPQLRLGADRRARHPRLRQRGPGRLVHYNDRSDVDRLLEAVAELAG